MSVHENDNTELPAFYLVQNTGLKVFRYTCQVAFTSNLVYFLSAEINHKECHKIYSQGSCRFRCWQGPILVSLLFFLFLIFFFIIIFNNDCFGFTLFCTNFTQLGSQSLQVLITITILIMLRRKTSDVGTGMFKSTTTTGIISKNKLLVTSVLK